MKHGTKTPVIFCKKTSASFCFNLNSTIKTNNVVLEFTLSPSPIILTLTICTKTARSIALLKPISCRETRLVRPLGKAYTIYFEDCGHFLPNSGISTRDTCRAGFGVCYAWIFSDISWHYRLGRSRKNWCVVSRSFAKCAWKRKLGFRNFSNVASVSSGCGRDHVQWW